MLKICPETSVDLIDLQQTTLKKNYHNLSEIGFEVDVKNPRCLYPMKSGDPWWMDRPLMEKG